MDSKSLLTQQDLGDAEDQYAVAVIKEDSGTSQTVVYVPRKLSTGFSYRMMVK